MPTKPHLVVLTGAGISAESGLQTFRDADGLWEGHAIEDVATPAAWARNPALVLQFYNHRRAGVLAAEPNAAHRGLAQLEAHYRVSIITQNIDDLHERAGSTRVLHLHGEIGKMRSEQTESLIYPISGDINLGDLAEDGAQLRPHIVWFGEPVPLIEDAARMVQDADLFVVVGTSLVVYPAAGLVDIAPRQAPRFIVDKKIPYSAALQGVTAIEKPASEGVAALVQLLTSSR
ncbi:MAG: NAD-dependent deacylase [Flaviaesturariibacter sp.]|nr:NAD-dependent deacylase [Flaviaesturariibacter sp.]